MSFLRAQKSTRSHLIGHGLMRSTIATTIMHMQIKYHAIIYCSSPFIKQSELTYYGFVIAIAT